MRYPALYRALSGRQGLAQHLPAEHLWAADIAALAAENVLLDTLQAEQRNQVIENRVHQ